MKVTLLQCTKIKSQHYKLHIDSLNKIKTKLLSQDLNGPKWSEIALRKKKYLWVVAYYPAVYSGAFLAYSSQMVDLFRKWHFLTILKKILEHKTSHKACQNILQKYVIQMV